MALLIILAALGTGAAGVLLVAVSTVATDPARVQPTGRAGAASPVPAVPAVPVDDAGPRGTGSTTSVAREVLREWDRRREAAWVEADEDALAALYLPDAVAGRRDVENLRRWSARGARVTRLEQQVLGLTVLRDSGRALAVRVTDRLGVLESEVAGVAIALPRDGPSTRRIVLRRGSRVTSPWKVASVRLSR